MVKVEDQLVSWLANKQTAPVIINVLTLLVYIILYLYIYIHLSIYLFITLLLYYFKKNVPTPSLI